MTTQSPQPAPGSPGSQTLPPPTPWTSQEVATDYANWDKSFCWTFGYPFALEALRLDQAPAGPVLDVGCGPGHLSQKIATTYERPVIGVDDSPGMIEIARKEYVHPGLEYVLMGADGLTFLEDESISGAICCNVFLTIPDLDIIRSLVREVHRAMRPGGRFVVLDVHPGSIGVEFSAFQVGEPGKSYADGEPKRTKLFGPDGEAVLLRDYHWNVPVFTGVLADAGFTDITLREPVLADAQQLADPESLQRHAWDAERTRSPYLIVSGTK